MRVAVVKQKLQIELSLHSLLQILSVSVFRERASKPVFCRSDMDEKGAESDNQFILFN